MSGFRNHRALALESIDAGRVRMCSFRKVPSAAAASVAQWWVDLSMLPGNPLPNYYAAAPLAAAVLDGSRGIFHGSDVSPASKHLLSMHLTTPSAAFVGPYILLDYALYYPFVDLDDLDEQIMDNTTPLPRHTTGEGVKPMIVCVAPTVGGGTFQFNYVNQAGAAKTSPVQSYSTAVANIGSIVTSEPATTAGGRIFAQLADGDSGVRSITSWTNIVSNGGLAAVVLVKRVTLDLPILELNATVEREYPQHANGMPLIPDGAYLNLITKCAASVASSTIAGGCEFVWSA